MLNDVVDLLAMKPKMKTAIHIDVKNVEKKFKTSTTLKNLTRMKKT